MPNERDSDLEHVSDRQLPRVAVEVESVGERGSMSPNAAFPRSAEFLWQEGHRSRLQGGGSATAREMLDVYGRLQRCSGGARGQGKVGRGALRRRGRTTIEALMNGWALVEDESLSRTELCARLRCRFPNQDGTRELVGNVLGVSTRLIGLVMTHRRRWPRMPSARSARAGGDRAHPGKD